MLQRLLAAVLLLTTAACGDDDRGGPSCPTGTTSCGGECVLLASNPSHCGACGNVCASGACVASSCVGVDGGVLDGNVPDGGVPDGSVPDGSVPDASVPDGDVPDEGSPDVSPDEGAPDMTPDEGAPDMTPDMAPDAGPDVDAGPACGTGMACSAARACTGGRECIPEAVGTVGGPDDPIVGFPGGGDSYATTNWLEGYCTEDLPTAARPFACDPDDPEDPLCGDCGTCVDFGNVSLCMDSCIPNFSNNSDCRDGYECNLGVEVCFPGCEAGIATEPACRTQREETNGIPGLQTPDDCTLTPADCGGMADNFDDLVYDRTSMATCDANTLRCVDPDRDTMASGGDPCTDDSMCEPRGFCIDDAAWPMGACIKTRCDLPGNACANDGVCQERGIGVPGCLTGCTVGDGAVAATPTTWTTGASSRGGCRAGYGCFWNGEDLAGVEDNGVCTPANFTAVAANVGDACTDDDDCYSPFGLGFCLTGAGFGGGYCSVRDCGAPFFEGAAPPSICGAGTECVPGLTDDPTFAVCLESCTTATDCRAGYGCVTVAVGTDACFACGVDTDCRTGETCTAGVCG